MSEALEIPRTLALWLSQSGSLPWDHRELERRLLERWPQLPREGVLLHLAAREGVAADLARSRASELPSLQYETLARRLHDDAGLALGEAAWAVRSWAQALGQRCPEHTPRPAPPERWTGPAIRVLRLKGSPMELKGHKRPARALRFWGRHLLSAGEDRTVRLWELPSGRAAQVGHLGHKDWIRAIVWDGARCWSGGDDGHVRAWTLGETLRRAERAPLFAHPVVALERCAPLGLFAAASEQGELLLLPSPERPPQLRLNLNAPIVSMCFEAQGRWLAVSMPGRVRLIDPEEGALLREIPTRGVASVSGGSSDLLLLGDADGLRLMRAGAGELLQKFEGHSAPVRGVALHAGGQSLASSSDDGSARIWQASDGRETYRLEPGRSIRALALSEAGAMALSVSDGALILCDTEVA